MGYDRFPEHLIEEKASLFRDFIAREEYLFFTHDPEVSAARLTESAGRFQPSHELAAFTAWDLDAHGAPV
jgi:hypothetical protein